MGARAVAAFAARHPTAGVIDEVAGALPAPPGAKFIPAPDEETNPHDEAGSKPGPSDSDAGQPKESKPPPGPAPTFTKALPSELEQRMQNDRLLRQLNAELLGLQKHAREHLSRQRANVLEKIKPEELSVALRLTAEVFLLASESLAAELNDAFAPPAGKKAGAMPGILDEAFTRHLGFIEACSFDLALSTDVRSQLVRLAVLLDPEELARSIRQEIETQLQKSGCWSSSDGGWSETVRTEITRRLGQLCK